MTRSNQTVAILGAGINGVAIARELSLNRVPVVLVDRGDIASGTTAYSSRLIHGGLRYLEYGELSLVRESLAERTRLLQLAPQFVQPLELQIPVRHRHGGWLPAIRRFLSLGSASRHVERGMWLVRSGLWMYDRYARDRSLPQHSVVSVKSADAMGVDPERYRWICRYWDAQVTFPERLVLSMLADARELASQSGTSFELYTYHDARLDGDTLELKPRFGSRDSDPARVRPAAIINATGAWVDLTLTALGEHGPPRIGGTKGTHFLTFHPPLCQAVGERGLYAEAEDGRPVFVLPLAGGVLVGTTDLPYSGDPAEAVATEDELQYLLDLVRSLLPQVGLSREHIALHYAGVRPLPHVSDTSPAGVTRRHWLEPHTDLAVPVFSVIGGKLTTCRSLAEQAADTVLDLLGASRVARSDDRCFPGGESFPLDVELRRGHQRELALRFDIAPESVAAVWALFGSRTATVLGSLPTDDRNRLDGCDLPRAVAHWAVQNEAVQTLEDLVERRLMLLYHPQLTHRCLVQLAEILMDEGRLTNDVLHEVQRTTDRLREHFGKRLTE